MNPATILLVDSDAELRYRVVDRLRQLGHRLIEADTAGQAVREVGDQLPDLMVLAAELPDVHGLEVLRDVRRNEALRPLRVVVTSASPDSSDVARALEAGADDFLAKPFQIDELVARVAACLRRPASAGVSNILAAGEIQIDQSSHRVTVAGCPITLAPREYRLMSFLLSNQEQVYSRSQLLIYVWDRDARVGPRTVDVHIRRLRKVLEPFGLAGYIQTVRGSGYRFSLEDG